MMDDKLKESLNKVDRLKDSKVDSESLRKSIEKKLNDKTIYKNVQDKGIPG